MALTIFPIETTNPKIEVTLDVGTHTLILEVEDSAGMKSQPVELTVEVKRVAITGIDPNSGTPGTTPTVTIQGYQLSGATAVTFDGDGISATVNEAASSSTEVVVELTISNTATGGPRSFSVTTPLGIVHSPEGVVFQVDSLTPSITAISEDSARAGETLTLDIKGENLQEAISVTFDGGGITTGQPTPLADNSGISVEVVIAETAATGDRQFTVTTPYDSVTSPEGIYLRVLPPLPKITGISPTEGLQGTKLLTVQILGDYLSNASAVTFSGTGITAGTPRRVTDGIEVDISINSTASTDVRSFTVTTPNGVVQSPRDVNFTVVERITPRITGISPQQGEQGTSSLTVQISGEYLGDASHVTFSGSGISAGTPTPSGTGIAVDISIASTASAGARSFRVTTPNGTVQSPSSAAFTVVEKLDAKITGILPTSGKVGTSGVLVSIAGTGLQTAQSVQFSGSGVSMTIDKATENSITGAITISSRAESGDRSFVVDLRDGSTVVSPRSVVFTVVGLVPEPFNPEPLTVEPVVTEPSVLEPVTVEPVVSERSVLEPVTVEPVVSERSVLEPVVAERSVLEPVVAERSVLEPVVSERSVLEPVVAERSVVEPTPAIAERSIIEPSPAIIDRSSKKTTRPAKKTTNTGSETTRKATKKSPTGAKKVTMAKKSPSDIKRSTKKNNSASKTKKQKKR